VLTLFHCRSPLSIALQARHNLSYAPRRRPAFIPSDLAKLRNAWCSRSTRYQNQWSPKTSCPIYECSPTLLPYGSIGSRGLWGRSLGTFIISTHWGHGKTNLLCHVEDLFDDALRNRLQPHCLKYRSCMGRLDTAFFSRTPNAKIWTVALPVCPKCGLTEDRGQFMPPRLLTFFFVCGLAQAAEFCLDFSTCAV
jgi:hypothetical protein